MLKRLMPGLWVKLVAVLFILSGCAVRQVDLQQAEYLTPYEQEAPRPKKAEATPGKGKKELAVVRRAITEKELRNLEQKDRELDFYRCLEILSRLNGKDKEYIRDDVKHKRAIEVPRDFTAYKDWSPLPRSLTGVGQTPKMILIVKDIAFIGWYERGKLAGDSYVCIGKMKTWTKRGMYRVKQKDVNHMSDYPNAYGNPSLMPFAMKIYERVWIHAGDVIGPNCSHGCINVPLYSAEKLFSWTDIGAVVLVTESLKDLGRDLQAGFPAKPPPQQVKPPRKEPVRTNPAVGASKVSS